MNKQEFQQNIKDMKPTNYINSITIYDAYSKGFEEAKQNVLLVSNFLAEPEKPVVPQFIAEWIEYHKEDYTKWDEEARADFVFRAINDLFRFGEGLNPWDFTIDKKFSEWTTKNAYKFITAILFGYTVKKEKLYTAKLKLTDEYLVYYASIKSLHHAKTTDNVTKREKVFHFTEDDLVKYHIWGNDNYEVKEVKE